jgi:TIR domain
MPPIEIFFSYAHKDERLMDNVRRQLILYDRLGLIEKWHDRRILPGQDFPDVIDDRLKWARIILLFVSPHFIESKYCYNVEVKEALRRHGAGEAVVIPIILRPCAWQDSPFGQLQALPRDGKAITKWQNRDEASLNVAEGVMRVVHEMSGNASPGS